MKEPRKGHKTGLGSALVRNVVHPVWVIRDHPKYPGIFRQLQRSQFFTRDEIEALQLSRLRKLLEHANQHCEFYRERFRQSGLNPSIRHLDELSKLAVLTKADIQNHGATMLADNIPAEQRDRNQTGGSTGSPLQFYVDKQRWDSRKASTVRHNLWAGLRPGDWHAVLWGARVDLVQQGNWLDWVRNVALYRKIELNTSSVTDEDWRSFLSRVREKRPETMLAYARAAVRFAEYVRDHKIEDVRFNSIITTAEVLLPEQRKLLQDVFHAEVFDRYGCREVSVIASECEFHSGMHTNAEAIYVEIMPSSRRAGKGKILITDLLNLSQPLIRYEIGDLGTWETQQRCPCGRGLPLLGRIEGRTTEFLVLANGKEISGPALTLVIADMPDVRQVQFVQTSATAITLRVVPGNRYGESTKEELKRRMLKYFGEETQLTLAETEEIPVEASGKYRFAINLTAGSSEAGNGKQE